MAGQCTGGPVGPVALLPNRRLERNVGAPLLGNKEMARTFRRCRRGGLNVANFMAGSDWTFDLQESNLDTVP